MPQASPSPDDHRPAAYHASITGRFLPSRWAGTRTELKRFATQRRESAGSMVSSMPKNVALFSALPRSYSLATRAS